jgi:hypothetical protein
LCYEALRFILCCYDLFFLVFKPYALATANVYHTPWFRPAVAKLRECDSGGCPTFSNLRSPTLAFFFHHGVSHVLSPVFSVWVETFFSVGVETFFSCVLA